VVLLVCAQSRRGGPLRHSLEPKKNRQETFHAMVRVFMRSYKIQTPLPRTNLITSSWQDKKFWGPLRRNTTTVWQGPLNLHLHLGPCRSPEFTQEPSSEQQGSAQQA